MQLAQAKDSMRVERQAPLSVFLRVAGGRRFRCAQRTALGGCRQHVDGAQNLRWWFRLLVQVHWTL